VLEPVDGQCLLAGDSARHTTVRLRPPGSLSAALRTAVTITACTWSDSLSCEEGLERNGPDSA